VHLWAREEATAAGDGGRRRGAARGDGEQFAHTGRRGREGEAAGENPHRNVEPLEHLLDGGERWSDAAASGQGVEAATAEELGRLRVFGRRKRLQLGEELGHEGAINRVAAALACGPGAPRGGC
jgi:hypothetical protein